MAATGKPRLNVKRTVAELEAELEKRTAERDEALARETATAEVLQVINASPGDLAPVFDAMLEKAIRLCGATYGHFRTYDGERFPLAAVRGEPSLVAIHRHHSMLQLGPNHPVGRFLQGEDVIHIADAAAIPAYRSDPAWRDLVDTGACRSLLAVALRRDRTLLGYLNVYRSEVRPFSDKEIALLQNFAAQAVIAMENARLLDELRTRTDDLQESLEYQTATSDVLEVISRSTFDLQPVLDTLVATAARLCNSHSSALTIREGDVFRYVAINSAIPELDAFMRQRTFTAGRGTTTGRAVLEGKVVHIPDVMADPEYDLPEITTIGNIRTTLSVPLLRDGAVIGTLNLGHEQVEPFTERQIELVRTFADQAVIAIENARLIAETREALEQQTATAEVLGVINSSPGDLVPVFDAMLDKALALCGAAFGVLWIYDGQSMRATAIRGATPEYARFLGRQAHPLAPGGVHERLRAGENAVHIPDLTDTDDYRSGNPLPRAFVELGGGRGLLAVALRKEERFLGNLAIYRSEVRPFTDKQVVLLQNFAAQAVIAMENARLITETREALEQQTATAEVLQVINSSPGDLAPVFEAMLEKAMQLCQARFGELRTYDGARFQTAATRGVPVPYAEYRGLHASVGQPGGISARILEGEAIVQILDLKDEEAYRAGHPNRRALVELGGARTALLVALSKGATVLGCIIIYRQEVRPFSEKQIALLQNFAAQAVVAIENARLITETREALDQQTATAEVLSVINSSPGDLTPVFDAILEKANTLCETVFGVLWTFDGTHFFPGAIHGPQAFIDAIKDKPRAPTGGGTLYRHAAGEQLVHIEDMAAETGVYETNSTRRVFVDLGGGRSALSVALSKDDRLLGAIQVYRQEVRPFTDKQIALLQNFAAQAVIAMENARLLTETREALEQQTATAEILQVISGSPADVQPTFDAIAYRAARLCEADFSVVVRYEEGLLHLASSSNVAVEELAAAETVRLFPRPPRRDFVMGRAVLEARAVQVDDVLADPDYNQSIQSLAQSAVPFRTLLAVPVLRNGEPIGAINLARRRVEAFTERQIDLVRTFADQAVIAIENVRLFNETREALEQQTATAEVLQVINASPGDLAPVFDAMLEKAMRLCEAKHGYMYTYDGERLHLTAVRGEPQFVDFMRGREPVGLTQTTGSPLMRAFRTRELVHTLDLVQEEVYRASPLFKEIIDVGGIRTAVIVPLFKESAFLGAMHIFRKEVRPFSDKQIALLQNFAAQAVIAMENARLITETREARDGAEHALRDLKAAQANLIQAEKMASLGQLTAGIAHEIKNPLNFVNNFAGLSVELLDELRETAGPALAALDEDQRADLDETMAMLSGNLQKIGEHGRRADNIVKSMLEHSRGVSGERREVDVNGLIDEALNLAYHGARAQDQGFNITLERDYAATLPQIELAPQEMTRVFLNLFGNGFYAANKRARANGDRSFRPVLSVATRDLGEVVEVKVRDNGTGIPPDIRDKLFQPFFTTKPTGEGTGLGLSISYDIVTQQHGGSIEVESRVGEFTEFTVRLPRHP